MARYIDEISDPGWEAQVLAVEASDLLRQAARLMEEHGSAKRSEKLLEASQLAAKAVDRLPARKKVNTTRVKVE